ncbi:Transforming acidic coiled-coil-containing protein 3 (ERIC-1)-like protein [Sarcoptes scabiei]|uniref:Transforming acidic coiled-coil-containing protein 3 (ERIC-1)-like protein n=1 Tax=Sarcoptes scabiei TaxID=52283 RepID=A0A132AJ98_SARSC|nr:Transforming acidic coiled-coil-containing protein 3 (ERIC-1)-like protein [Sarcoptes scabiei]
MSESIDEDQQQQFKPSEKFLQELGALKYSNVNTEPSVTRMSIVRQFDPMTADHQTPNSNNRPSISIQSVNVSSPAFVQRNSINLNLQNPDPGNDNEIESSESNQSATLIHLNTPLRPINGDHLTEITNSSNKSNGCTNLKNSFLEPQNEQIIQMNEEIGNLELKSENLELLIGQLALINEEVIELAMKKINKIQKDLEKKDEAYDNLRSLVKEMDNRESQNRSKTQELISKLKEKEQECKNWKQQAEEAVESANQRVQNVSSTETVSLKAQIKVLEMRVNSLQSQIEQKNRENEELSNIVNELIATNKAT